MSQALQRVVVRMLFDPALVARVYAGEALPELSAAELAMLRDAPRAAWQTDPYRRSRTLQALIEEYPVSAAVIGPASLHAFFSDRAFHDAIQDRRRLALEFGRWLQPRAGALARLEHAVAAARRRLRPPGTGLLRAPGVVEVSLPAGTLAAWQQVRQRLGPDPLAALLDPGFRPLRRPPAPAAQEHWLAQVDDAGEVQLGGGSSALNGLLLAAAEPTSRDALLRAARELGAEPGEASEILDDLLAEGLLVAV